MFWVKLILLIAFVFALVPTIAYVVGRFLRIDRRADVTHHVRTADGWTLALHEYRPAPDAPKRDEPVLCCHGLGGNRVGFDFSDRTSMARALASRGHRVFLLELRGAGESETPIFYDTPRWKWNFDTYVDVDAPAAIDAVLAVTGAKKLHWVGHSMGGMIGYCVTQGPRGDRLASLVTMGSPGSFAHAEKALVIRPVVSHLKAVYLAQISQLFAPLIEYIPKVQRWTGNENLLPGDYAKSFANLQSNIPMTLLLQFGEFASHRTVRSYDGRDFLAGLANVTVPYLCIGAENDYTIPPSSVQVIHDAMGTANKRLHIVGPSNGTRGRYGHLTMLIGRDAADELYPVVFEWLESGWKAAQKPKPESKPARAKKPAKPKG